MAAARGKQLPDAAPKAEVAPPESGATDTFNKGAYFIGKAVWGKGYTELLELMAQQKSIDGSALPMDIFGHGEDIAAIEARAKELGLHMNFKGAQDHMDASLHGYRVLVNASTSDVVATTSAEALAMGKWLLCARHPENVFFEQFQNALIYSSPQEFAQLLRKAMENEPPPLSEKDHRRLTWEDATTRLLEAAEISSGEWPAGLTATKDTALWHFWRPFTGIDTLRRVLARTKSGQEAQADLERAARARPDGESSSDTDDVFLEQGQTGHTSAGFRVGFKHNSTTSGMQLHF